MSISDDEVDHLADLARLDLGEEKKDELEDDLNEILDLAEKIQELDTDDVEPTNHVLPLNDVTREDEVREGTVQELDENAALYAADGLAEETGDGYRIDARDVADDGYDADVVKVLGDGQVRNELSIVADAFTASAVEKLESAGGSADLSERAEAAEADEADDSEESDEE